MVDFDEKLDCSGMNCPMPILHAKKKLADMVAGKVLLIISTDPASVNSIPSIIRQFGHELLETGHDGDKYHYLVKKT